MKYKTKKEFNLEQRIERLQKQVINPSQRTGSGNAINLGKLYKDIVPWFYQVMDKNDMVPVFITMTFKNLPEGHNAHQMVTDNVSVFYRRALLPFLVHRQRYHKYKEQHPVIIAFPEFGRGELDDWHLHGIMFVKRAARIKALTENGKARLNNRFRGISSHNLEFHMAPTTDENDISEMTAYMLKKVKWTGVSIQKEGFLFIWK